MPGFNLPPLNSNSIEILKTALPYMNNRARRPMQFVIQAEELVSSLRSTDDDSSVSAQNIKEEAVDIEPMLLQIKDLFTSTDQEMIDFLINFMRTQKLYRSYQMFMANQPSGKRVSGLGLGGNNSLYEFLMTQMTPEQKSTFETLSMMMNAMQTQ